MSAPLRPDLAAVVDDLLEKTAPDGVITLDLLGEAIGTAPVGSDEVDAMMSAIEARGRQVVAAEGGRGELHLKRVLDAARALRAELGRPPRPEEIAARAGLSREEVRHALALARIMQR